MFTSGEVKVPAVVATDFIKREHVNELNEEDGNFWICNKQEINQFWDVKILSGVIKMKRLKVREKSYFWQAI